MITACVPFPDMAAALAGLDAELLTWDGSTEPPAGIERVEFLVPTYMGAPAAGTLPRMRALQVIQLLSAGYERWQPLVPDGVTLCNARGVHGGSTAELAVGGLIALLRGLPGYAEQQRAGVWERHESDGIDGKRVLLLGVGDIGGRIEAALRAFGASTTSVGRTPRPGVRGVDEVPALLAEHDVVVVALPYEPGTHRLVDAQFLARMPDGSCLVNVARGAIVDTEALLVELNSRRLSAFLDVTDPEPLPPGHPLWTAPNLLLTPHVGGGTRGWAQRAQTLVREQLARYLAGEPLLNVV